MYRDAAPRSKLRGAAFSARRTKNINYLQHNLERLLLMAQRPVFLRTAIRLGWGTAQLIESDHAGNAMALTWVSMGVGTRRQSCFGMTGLETTLHRMLFDEGEPSEVCRFIRAASIS